MSREVFYLGVDGGGSKTEFICIDQDRNVVARATTGTTYHLQIGLDSVLKRLDDGLSTICRALGTTTDAFAFVFLGLPAFGEDDLIDPQLDRAVRTILGHARYRCGNDMICGWAGSLGCADGINLVAGTGSIGYGERRGRTARGGGWGEVFGDEGSAYWIAIQGLNAFSRMSDGRLPRGPLHHHLKSALGLVEDIDLCARVMGKRGLPRDELAALSRIVAQAADEGDAVAADILVAAAGELFALAEALRVQLDYPADEIVELSWSGGVLVNVPAVREALQRRLLDTGAYRLVEPRHSPGVGAALYAAHLAGASIIP